MIILPTYHEHSDCDILMMSDWDQVEINRLIDEKKAVGDCTSTLELGRHEMALLRRHLLRSHEEEAAMDRHHIYYKGLKVVFIEHEKSFFRFTKKKNRRLLEVA